MHHNPLQFHSQHTDGPTVTLGNQYQTHYGRTESHSRRKEQLYHPGRGEDGDINGRLHLEIELRNCQSEIETLKQHIELDEKEKGALEQTIIQLKKERAAAHSENQKLFQDNEKHRQLLEKLKIDNRSMEMEIDRFRSERKVYYSNLNNIEALRRDVAAQIAEKNTTIDELSTTLRKIERNHSECRLKIEEFERLLCESESQKQELREELKSTLEKYLTHGNVLTKLEYQLKEANELNSKMKDRIYELEEERKELYLKLGFEANSSRDGQLSESMRSTFPTSQRSMLQIQSYMKQIGNLLDIKREEFESRDKGYYKLKHSIENLELLL